MLTHEAVRNMLRPGVPTQELDGIAGDVMSRHGAVSSFRETTEFPKQICISVNDEVGHGIPGARTLCPGDLVKVDIGVLYDGMHADCARTHVVGRGTPEARRLLGVTKLALDRGINAIRIHGRLSDVSHAVWQTVTAGGFDVFRQAFGHGIGHQLHEEPQIASFGPPGLGPVLLPHTAFAIEPVVVAGDRAIKKSVDGWTECTLDGRLAAHFEDTVLLTPAGPEIVTRS